MLIRLSFCVYKTYLTIFFPIRSFLSWRDANISVSPIASTRREAKRKRENSLATQISQQRELPWRAEKQTFLSITEHRRTVCWCCSATSQQPTKTGPDRIWLAGWLDPPRRVPGRYLLGREQWGQSSSSLHCAVSTPTIDWNWTSRSLAGGRSVIKSLFFFLHTFSCTLKRKLQFEDWARVRRNQFGGWAEEISWTTS